MHAVGLHSALAIKRQRKRRDEQKRARERRYSSQSTESGLGESRSSCASPRASTGSLDRRRFSRRGYRRPKATESDKVVSSVGMLHIGVVFLVLGLFLFASGLIPDDLDNWSKDYKWFNELFISGVAIMLLGIFFIILNKIIMKKEEEDLTEYVQRQLTRSRSGHRLVRDLETGCLTTKSESKLRNDAERSSIIESQMNGIITPVHFSPTVKSPPPLSVSTPRSDLERILEEEISVKSEEDRLDRFARENVVNTSYSPSPEGRELITARYYDLEFYEK
ncbi:uncharacterized protein [Rhodnius prolixus]|uniref:uncharacterized protein n=1 Tax=Rhodnius prolixus TaxID=13249 RepID=UPI003D18DB42